MHIPKRPLAFAERWMRDGLAVHHVPSFAQFLEADAETAAAAIEAARASDVRITYTHIMVRAAAIALSKNPDLHVLICGRRRVSPNRIDIALSVAGETFLAPVMIIEDAGAKTLPQIANEVAGRVEAVRAQGRRMVERLNRWGWLVPLGVLRRALLRTATRSFTFRRNGGGTFHVSLVPGVDSASSSVFSTSAMLIAGAVRKKPVVRAGVLTARLSVTLTCCADHRVWDGRAGERFLRAVKDCLEGNDLLFEVFPARGVSAASAAGRGIA